MQNTPKKGFTLFLASIGIFLGVLCLMTIFFLLGTSVFGLSVVSSSQQALQWPFVAIIGVVFLLISLTFMSIVFKELGVHDPRQALGLPQGSIRAVIALCLVVVFIIFVIFLYYDLAHPIVTKIVGLSQESYNQIKPEQMQSSYSYNGTNGETLYGVYLLPSDTTAAKDLAKQVVTLVGTLMAAVASFYFGSRVGEEKQAQGSPSLAISSTSPEKNRLAKTPGNKMTIRLKTKPSGGSVSWDPPDGDPDGTLMQTKPGEFEYTRGSNPQDIVHLRFSLVNYPDETVELPITEKP